ncbi:MAG: ATP-binding cassette domain-containing protein [Acidimicrobiia bacterium]|nr:ATP-binding cassette domain-containing protein [Acidimicrobiia bacterium]
MDHPITVRNLHKKYRGETVVENVSFSVNRGEIFGILGPNGAGKTTTVEILQGLRSRQGGTVDVLGYDPARESGSLRRKIGSQLQSAALPDRMRVQESIALFSRAHDADVDVDDVLERWSLTELRRRAFATLSGGQAQRLFLALALLGNPEVVFLDELTTALDPTARRATWELVREVRDKGATIILVTHFMEEAEALCDRVAIMDRGRIVALDSPGRLTTHHGEEMSVTFTANGHDPNHLSTVDGVRSVSVEAGTVTLEGDLSIPVGVASALADQGFFPTDFRTHHPSLEDVFLSMTGRSLTSREAS